MNPLMRITPLIVPFSLLFASGLAAQNAPAPAAVAQRLDTPQARVFVATLQPRTPSIAKNGHATNRVLIYLDNGVMTRKEGEQSTSIEFRRGDVRWRPASGAYIAENISDHPIRILEVDLKGPPAGPAPVSKLDPVKVDGKHYKVEFENEHVRVLRIHFGAREKGETHEHILNRVVFYLNDQTAREGGRRAHGRRRDTRGGECLRSSRRQNRRRAEVAKAAKTHPTPSPRRPARITNQSPSRVDVRSCRRDRARCRFASTCDGMP